MKRVREIAAVLGVFILLGPIFGGLTVFSLASIVGDVQNEMFLFVIVFSYFFGLAPAALTGLLFCFGLYKFTEKESDISIRRAAFLGSCSGSIVALGGIFLFGFGYSSLSRIEIEVAICVIATHSIAGCLCGIFSRDSWSTNRKIRLVDSEPLEG
ncbi:hypothetical protein [Marinobacter sp. HN1S83]|uniref:hypothetical protein n=1 Tax=Marinobacter sp. HN1S83 TaxID=3382301 RepID=UPI00387B2A62